MTVKTRILFVDDEPLMLQLIGDLLHSMKHQWEVGFAESGHKALAMMAENPFDLVVSDMRMPVMSGAELFLHVQRRHPRTVRIIQSGYSDPAQVMEAAGVAHQFLMKPVLQTLFDALDRIQLMNQSLLNDNVRTLVARMTTLPSMPAIYFRILDALQSHDSTIDQIADIISADPALTAKVLQMVNSAFFGFAQPVLSANQAVQMLGVNRIRSLALSAHVFSAFDPASVTAIPMDHFWAHSLRTGMLAQKIARKETRDPGVLEQAFTAGTLHDIGKLILAANVPEQYLVTVQKAQANGVPLSLAEREVFGASHADVGAYLLGVWGLPMSLVEAVALHHEPGRTRQISFAPLTAVHLANALVHEQPAEGHSAAIDTDYLQQLGLSESLKHWQMTVEE